MNERVVIYDGAMGTNIQKRNPTLDDYWGKENCSEVLVLSRPDIIRDIHEDFLRVGCDVVETNTFGATRLVLREFDLPDRVQEINLAAVKLAKDAGTAIFHQRQAAVCGGIDGADDETAVAGAHWLRRDGGGLRGAGAGAD